MSFEQVRTNRQTGTTVWVASAADAGLDPGPEGETAWYTVCLEHNQCTGHATLALARGFAADPLTWCEVCNGNDSPPDHGG